jgi:hypothetical protein
VTKGWPFVDFDDKGETVIVTLPHLSKRTFDGCFSSRIHGSVRSKAKPLVSDRDLEVQSPTAHKNETEQMAFGCSKVRSKKVAF